MEEEVRSVLTDGKVLLQFVLVAVVEAFRRNPGKYNNLILYNMPSSSSSSSLTPIPTEQPLPFHIEGYNDIIIEIAGSILTAGYIDAYLMA